MTNEKFTVTIEKDFKHGQTCFNLYFGDKKVLSKTGRINVTDEIAKMISDEFIYKEIEHIGGDYLKNK